jgi:hypothetical protein
VQHAFEKCCNVYNRVAEIKCQDEQQHAEFATFVTHSCSTLARAFVIAIGADGESQRNRTPAYLDCEELIRSGVGAVLTRAIKSNIGLRITRAMVRHLQRDDPYAYLVVVPSGEGGVDSKMLSALGHGGVSVTACADWRTRDARIVSKARFDEFFQTLTAERQSRVAAVAAQAAELAAYAAARAAAASSASASSASAASVAPASAAPASAAPPSPASASSPAIAAAAAPHS